MSTMSGMVSTPGSGMVVPARPAGAPLMTPSLERRGAARPAGVPLAPTPSPSVGVGLAQEGLAVFFAGDPAGQA
jgi:hypothetical protein